MKNKLIVAIVLILMALSVVSANKSPCHKYTPCVVHKYIAPKNCEIVYIRHTSFMKCKLGY